MESAELAGDRFLIEQLIRPVVNLYRITPLAAGQAPAGPPVAFVRQKRMALKEDIRVFRDESESEELFRIKGRTVMEVAGRYDVTDPAGTRIGVLQKLFRRSLLRSTWRVLDPEEAEVAHIEEESMTIAILRRLKDFLPYGELIPIPYHFTISAAGRRLGVLRREFSIRDRYTLDLSGDPERALDRRVALALAVGLDAMQRR